MPKIVPILKPSDFGKKEKFLFKEKLVEHDKSPVVVYAKDEGRMIAYDVASDEKDFNLKFPRIKKEALSNLKKFKVSYDIQKVQGTNVLFAGGHEYTSEKILDKDFMKEIAKKLNATHLMVGIPFKGALMAIDYNSDLRMKFPLVIKQYYDNPQQDVISDKAFLVQEGMVSAIFTKDSSEDKSDSTAFSFSEDKDQNYTIEVNSKNIKELTDDVNLSLQEVMLIVMDRGSFGGEITYKLNDNIKLDDKLIDKCHSYIDQLENNEMLQSLSQALAKSKVKFKFYHNDKLIAPDPGYAQSSKDKPSKDEPSKEKSTKSQTTKRQTTKSKPSIDLDLSSFSNDELDKEFQKILKIYNKQKDADSLAILTLLTQEYIMRGLKLPNERKKKKWWEFWK
jgi:hypothetical protein